MRDTLCYCRIESPILQSAGIVEDRGEAARAKAKAKAAMAEVGECQTASAEMTSVFLQDTRTENFIFVFCRACSPEVTS